MRRVSEILRRVEYKPNCTIRAEWPRFDAGRKQGLDSIALTVAFAALDATHKREREYREGEFTLDGDAVRGQLHTIEYDRITVQRTDYLSIMEILALDTKQLVLRIFEILRDMEIHEAQEWFKLDGTCLVEPHPELSRVRRLPDDQQ